MSEKDFVEIDEKALEKVTGGAAPNELSDVHKNTIYRNREDFNLYAWVITFVSDDMVVYHDVTKLTGARFRTMGDSKQMSVTDFCNQYLIKYPLTNFTLVAF